MEHFRKITKLAALIRHIFMRTLQASFTSGRCLCLRHVFSSTIILRALWISCLFLLWLCITKPCTHLHPAPSTSTQLISAFTQLHPPPLSSFQPPSSSLQQPQQYLNQNIACNWAISPNLGRKIKSWPFWLKIDTHGILEVLIPNPGLDFWSSDPKTHFWAHLGPKIQSCPFCLKIGAHSISRILIPNPDLDF